MSVIRIALAGTLLALAAAKLVFPLPPEGVASQVPLVVALLEIAIAVLVLMRNALPGLVLAALLAGGFLLLGPETPGCGCFGAWKTLESYRTLVAAILGCLATAGLLTHVLGSRRRHPPARRVQRAVAKAACRRSAVAPDAGTSGQRRRAARGGVDARASPAQNPGVAPPRPSRQPAHERS